MPIREAPMREPAALDLSDIPAVDGHCHPLVAASEELSRERFLDLFSEGRAGTMRAHVAQTGYLRRALRGLADGLGCEPTVEAVLERRRAGGAETARRRFAGSRITALLVDTGYPAAGPCRSPRCGARCRARCTRCSGSRPAPRASSPTGCPTRSSSAPSGRR